MYANRWVGQGGYKGSGISSLGTSGGALITSTQFGDNYGHDIQLSGLWNGNVIANNQFIGSANRPLGVYDAVQLWNTADNSIVGNMIRTAGLYAGVQFVDTPGTNLVMSNTFTDGWTDHYVLTSPGSAGPFPSAHERYNLEH